MIALNNVSFAYESSREGESQLRHVDLQVGKGELVILAGRSGCGKTTLTRVQMCIRDSSMTCACASWAIWEN